MAEKKNRGFGHIRLRHQGRCRGLWHAVLAVAATALRCYKSPTFGEGAAPDHVASFLQPAGASARLPAGGPACAAPRVSYFSLILAVSLFLQSFRCEMHGRCPHWSDLPSQPCFISPLPQYTDSLLSLQGSTSTARNFSVQPLSSKAGAVHGIVGVEFLAAATHPPAPYPGEPRSRAARGAGVPQAARRGLEATGMVAARGFLPVQRQESGGGACGRPTWGSFGLF